MTGADILDAILADSFETSRRAEALTWANAALGVIWNEAEWEFRKGSDSVKVTAGSHVVSELPDDFGIVIELFRADGEELVNIPEYRHFAGAYLGTGNEQTGLPEAYCAQYGAISVGPKSSETNTGYLLVYEKRLTLLADDATECALPEETHLAVVFAAKAAGYLLTNAERAAVLRAQRDEIVAGMRLTYLTSQRGAVVQAPPYRPGC